VISYEVTAEMDPALAGAYERYMRATHIPEVLATGCFASATFAAAGPGRYRSCYVAATQADLDRYLERHTASLRAAFATHFPVGVTLSRQVWDTLEEWEVDAPGRGRPGYI
jgi:hypothetical protein